MFSPGKKILILLTALLLIPMIFIGQQVYIDSIEKKLTQNLDDVSRLDCYFKLAKSYRNVNAYIGLDFIDSSLQMANKLNDPQLIAEITNESGVLYRKLDLYEEALDQHQKALIKFENLQDSMGIAYTYANIGNVFLTIGQLDKALEYNLKSLKVKIPLGDSVQMAYSLRTTAIAFQALEQYDSAFFYFTKALDIYDQKGKDFDLANIYYHLGSLKLETGSSQHQALMYLGKALNLYKELDNYYGSSVSKYQAGKVYFQLGELDRAELYFSAALPMAKMARMPRVTMNIYYDLSSLNKMKGSYAEALNYYENYSRIRDSLYSDNFSKNISEMQEKYQRDAEIINLKEENELMRNEEQLSNAYLIMLILGIVFALIMLAVMIWRYIENKKNNLQLEKEVLIRKAHEQKLTESEKKLTEANAAKDKFFSIISHDLKSPFGAMKGLVEMLDSGYDSFDDSEKREIITEIGRATKNTYSLLEDLLVWSQTQRGTIDFNPEVCDLASYCKSTVELVLPFARKKDLFLHCELSNGFLVKADRNMLTTIIRNLLSNAIKFTPRGGEIILSAMNRNNGFIEISVSDTGVGIDEKDLSKIFKTEEKFETRGTENESGTGLGLIICKEFVEIHKGVLTVNSKVNHGSIFTFTIPAG